MRIGVFGGTFDPPHLGHLILASEALCQLNLNRLFFVLTSKPPHKKGQPITPIEIREKLVKAALTGNPAFEFSRVDIDRPGPHYAVDTVNIIRQESPSCELVYLIGGDSLRNLPKWHKPRELVQAIDTLGVMRRPGINIDWSYLETHIPGISHKVNFVDAPLLEISSSEIRKRVAEESAFRYYIPVEVYKLIIEAGLYKNSLSHTQIDD
ncbi:MAG: nicotinate (nicotinamide) nucleotide adenylyltransferase [Anaerolineales bacterium]|nr:nicotinate (nicotinamide) nucleotide adenylyltransferase [Anaerolineales bacterium]